MILGIDLGYGYVKVTRDGKTVQAFPSIVGSGGDREFASLFGGSTRGLDEMCVEVNGTTYYVGDLAAATSIDASRAIDRNKTHHDHTKVLLATSVLLSQPGPGEDIHLFTGLPLGYVKEQKNEFRAALENMNVVVKGISGPFQGHEREVRFSTVRVLPQAIGAMYAMLMDEHGRPRYPDLTTDDDPLLLIDVGHKTTDFTVFQITPRLRVLEEWSGTLDIGASTIYQMVKKDFPEIPERDVEKAVMKRRLWVSNKMLDMSDSLARIRDSVAKAIMNDIKQRLGDRMNRVRSVFLSGGTAILLQQALRDIHPDTRMGTQGDNAIGFWNMGNLALVPVGKEPPRIGGVRV